MTNDLVIGIVAGILTSLVIFLFTKLTNKLILPGIRRSLYRGPDISGHWESYDSDEPAAKPVGTADIVQRGENIAVNLVRHTSRSGRSINRRFIYQGRFVSGQITLLFEDMKMKGYITGAIVFKLSANNRMLSGKSVYLDQDEGAVVARDYWLKRRNSE